MAHRECSSRRRAGLLLRRVPEYRFEKAGRPGHMLAFIKAVTRAAFLGHQCVELLLPVGGNRRGALGRAVRGRWRGREWRGVAHGERGKWRAATRGLGCAATSKTHSNPRLWHARWPQREDGPHREWTRRWPAAHSLRLMAAAATRRVFGDVLQCKPSVAPCPMAPGPL